METRIRPTLVIGIGQWGAQVAAAFVRRVARRAGRLPVMRAVALVGEGADAPPGVTAIPLPSLQAETGFPEEHLLPTALAAALLAELRHIRRLDAVQATQRAGWRVERRAGSGVVLTASLRADGMGTVSALARLLRLLAERDFACRTGLSAVLLWPRDAEGGEATGAEARALPPGSEARGITADDLFPFDEGCVLLDQVNADGLLVSTGEEQADMVGNWLVLQAMTALQVALDRTPPGEIGRHFDALGLAAWEFPLEPLTAHLAHRWQWEVLGRLLVPSDGDQGAAVAFLERHDPAGSPWPRDVPVRFSVTGETWATPALDLVNTLRREIDEAVDGEWARLDALTVDGQEPLSAACRETQAALAMEVDALLDGPGLGTASAFLVALADAARLRATRLEREAERCCARVEELEQRAGGAGSALDDLTGRFPPCQLRALVGLALRPWRLLQLWLLYREIGRRAGTYLAYRQAQWLLQAQARERQWQAAFYAALAQAAGDEQAVVAPLRARLERLRDCLAPDRVLEQALARRLEAAALPAGLADYFYRQVTGDMGPCPAGLLALYGPLSRWARECWEAETVRLILEEHAQEQFAFLAEVRLDELVARTYSGAELRRRLAALVDAASPWWAWDEPALDADERAHLCRLVLVGLPDADRSPLVDLLPDRPSSSLSPPLSSSLSSCFSTGDRHQVVAAQVIQGMPLTALSERPTPSVAPPSTAEGPEHGSLASRSGEEAEREGLARQGLAPEGE